VQVRSGENIQAEERSKRQEGVVPPLPDDGALNVQRATDELARRVMRWRTAPDRFIKSGRSWIPRWRFQPFAELADAFQLLDQAVDHYTLKQDGRTFTVEIRAGSGRVTAWGELKARTIALAVAQMLGPEVDR
jgi:hypothetical protein